MRELCAWEGSKIQKIYQDEDTFIFSIYKQGEKTFLVIRPPHALYLSDEKPTSEKLSALGTRLRGMLTSATITRIEQIANERILRLTIQKEETYHVYLELFSKGNLIICSADDTIILPWRKHHYTSRSLTRGEKYLLPPERDFVIGMDKKTFTSLFEPINRNVSTTLAKAGLGRVYAGEACARAGIDAQAETISKQELEKLHTAVQDLTQHPLTPALIRDNNEIIGIEPFELVSVLGEREEKSTLSEAIRDSLPVVKKESKHDKEITKIETIIKTQQETVNEYERRIGEYSRKAELLYEHYEAVQDVLRAGPTTDSLLVTGIDKAKKTIKLRL